MLNFKSVGQAFCVVIAFSVSLNVFAVKAEGSINSTINSEVPSTPEPQLLTDIKNTKVQASNTQENSELEKAAQAVNTEETHLQEATVVEKNIEITSAPVSSSSNSSSQKTQVGKHISSDIDLFSMLTSLFVVIAVIFISAILLKRFQLNQPINGGLKIVSSLSLGTKERLVVVQAGEKQLIVGVTAHNINLISELEEPLQSLADLKRSTDSQRKPNDTLAALLKNTLFSKKQA